MLHIYVYSANIATLSCHRSTRNAAAAEAPGCRAAKAAGWPWRCPRVAIPRHSLSNFLCPLGRARGSSQYNLLSLAIKNKPVLPALLCGASAGNCSHCYIGKVCCLLLVQADYIGSAPGAAQKAWAIALAAMFPGKLT